MADAKSLHVRLKLTQLQAAIGWNRTRVSWENQPGGPGPDVRLADIRESRTLESVRVVPQSIAPAVFRIHFAVR